MRRITCVLKKSPLPDSTGSRRRHLRLVESLAEAFSTRLIILGRVDGPEIEALTARGVEFDVPTLARRVPSTAARARWLAGREQAHDFLWIDPSSTQAEVGALLRAHRADVVWCSGPALASMVPTTSGAPLVVDLAHAETMRIRRELRIGVRSFRGSPTEAKRLALLAADAPARLARETAVLGRTALATPVSEVERAQLADKVAGKVEIIPNGVDLPHAVGWRPGSRNLLFVGNLHYAPNLDAATWLARELLPAIRASVPDAALDIVGSGPPGAADLARAAGVRLHGFVESLDPLYASAGVVVAPLRAGSGTKLKVLEAFAHGVPVVTTPIGIEGIPARNGIEVRVAGDARAITDAVVQLLGDPDAARAQGAAGRALAARDYGWPSIGRRLVDAVHETCDRGPAPPRER